MDAGSAGGGITAIPWRRALLLWMLFVFVESILGAAREIFIAPLIGGLRARQLGVLVASVIILTGTWLCSKWLGATTRRAQLLVGAFWVALTVAFEMALGRAIGTSWERIFSDYNPVRGGFMLAGLALMFFAPMLAAKVTK